MNYKLEKFWNKLKFELKPTFNSWTINLKSFEILIIYPFSFIKLLWTINLKSFEILIINSLIHKKTEWTINLKSFEIKREFFHNSSIYDEL